MARNVAFVLTLLFCALLVGLAALLPRAYAQDRTGPPDRRDTRQRGPENAGRGRSSPPPSSPSRSTPPPPSSTSSDQASGSGPDVRGYARSLVAQHDKNGNMMLEGDERAGLRGQAAQSDLNGDGVITVDELVMHLSAPSAAGAAASPAPQSGDKAAPNTHDADQRVVFGQSARWQSSASSGAAPGQGEKAANQRPRPYRFRSPQDRLPEGLPGFFSRDSNGDGQISMCEYSRHWSDRMVAEFRRYDLDNDGMITPKECRPGE